MNQRILTLGASTVAAILVVALVFLPGFGTAGSSINTQTSAQAGQTKQIAMQSPGSVLDGLKLVMPSSFTQLSPQQAYAMSAPHVNVNLVAIEKTISFPAGISNADHCGNVGSPAPPPCLPAQIIAYTFNGTIPAPIIRVTEGSIVTVTITDPNTNTDGHSVDNHASVITAGKFFPTTSTASYTFVATQPGVWEYHCEGNVDDLAEHVFRGMHGMVIVDPAAGYTGYPLITPNHANSAATVTFVSPKAKEVALDFSEYYLDPTTGDFDWQAMYNHQVSYAHINGIPFGYNFAGNLLNPAKGNLPPAAGAVPLQFNAGDHVRFFLVNTGDWPVNFHIVGEILDRVTQGGAVQTGVQTFNLGGSNGAVIDVTFTQPGAFVIVNHDYSQLFKGQVATIIVCKSGDPADLCGPIAKETSAGPNPSNAVPPPSASGQSLHQDVTSYTFGTPLNWDGNISDLPTNQQPSPSCTDNAGNPCAGTTDTGAPYTGPLPSWYKFP